MSTFLAPHYTDVYRDRTYRGREERVRTIRNWSNRETPEGLWLPSAPDFENDASMPPHWDGMWDFRHRQLGSALQSFAVDSTDAVNRAMVGMRLSARPGCWLNFKAVGVEGGITPTFNKAERSVTWTDLWPDTDLTWSLHDFKVEKLITLKSVQSPYHFRFALRYPAGFSHTVSDNILRIFDRDGVEVFKTRPPWARDSSVLITDGIEPGRRLNTILIPAPDITVGQRQFPTVRLVVDPGDLAAAVFPVMVDPTVTLSSTSDVQDSMLVKNNVGPAWNNLNYGGSNSLYMGLTSSSFSERLIVRLTTASLPSGTVSSFVQKFWDDVTDTNNAAANTLEWYRLSAANNQWVEGTANGVNQVGSCDGQHQVSATVTWAGSNGASTPTTDYLTDASPPSLAIPNNLGVGTARSVSLAASWVSDWKSGLVTNSGMIVKGTNEGTGEPTKYRYMRFYPSEAGGSTSLRFDITYTTGPAFPYSVLMGQRRKR